MKATTKTTEKTYNDGCGIESRKTVETKQNSPTMGEKIKHAAHEVKETFKGDSTTHHNNHVHSDTCGHHSNHAHNDNCSHVAPRKQEETYKKTETANPVTGSYKTKTEETVSNRL